MSVQAHCYWCNEEIIEERVFDVKCFYNQTWSGKPICAKCAEGLKTNGSASLEVLRKRLGLTASQEPQQKIKKWI